MEAGWGGKQAVTLVDAHHHLLDLQGDHYHGPPAGLEHQTGRGAEPSADGPGAFRDIDLGVTGSS